jgi:hypothetical protein
MKVKTPQEIGEEIIGFLQKNFYAPKEIIIYKNKETFEIIKQQFPLVSSSPEIYTEAEKIIKSLIEQKADLTTCDNDKSENKMTALQYIADHPDLALALIETGSFPKEYINEVAIEFLSQSMYYKGLQNLEKIKLTYDSLLYKDLNSKFEQILETNLSNSSKELSSVLLKVCGFCTYEVVDYLIKQKVDVNSRNDKDQSVLQIAHECKNAEVVDYLIKNMNYKSTYNVEIESTGNLKEYIDLNHDN